MEICKSVFREAVKAVNPVHLIREQIVLEGNFCWIADKGPFELPETLFVIGFGKAALRMGIDVHKKFGTKIKSGILSVPIHSLVNSEINQEFLQIFKVIEGAKNNQPDEASYQAATEIVDLLSKLDSSDLVLALISGGGSALLPMPIEGVTLAEKQETIAVLSRAGVTIQEMNAVRRRLSKVKGGGLLRCTKAKIISLIISDVINDPLDVIASGPTYPSNDSPSLAWDVIEKFRLQEKIPLSVVHALSPDRVDEVVPPKSHENYTNILIGTNTIALSAAKYFIERKGYDCFILTNQMEGEARVVGSILADITRTLIPAASSDTPNMALSFSRLKVDPNLVTSLLAMVKKCKLKRRAFCLVLGGETTVHVKGTGIGGRNQELALSWAIEIHELREHISPIFDVVLLSAGTDGIDGPTDAAGAFGTVNLVEQAMQENLDAKSFLENNDAYSFYKNLSRGEYLFQTGHTGTNVMDVILLFFMPLTCD